MRALASIVAVTAAMPAGAAVTVYTSQDAFFASQPKLTFKPAIASDFVGSAGNVTTDRLSFTGSCTADSDCLGFAGDRLYVSSPDSLRKCSNAVPDTTSYIFDTCLYDYAAGQGEYIDDGQYEGEYFPSYERIASIFSLDVNSADAALGLTFHAPFDDAFSYTVNGVSGSFAAGQSGGFIGFAADSPINVHFSGPAVFAVTGYSATPAMAAVPEPASWALMILGFGAVGYGLRRRAGKPALA